MNLNHIFIHSTWRSSSTYVWQTFRRLDTVKGFYEPFHDCLNVMTPEKSKGSNNLELGHSIGKPYWLEYEEVASLEGGVPHYHKNFAIKSYIPPEDGLPQLQKSYIQVLLSNAEQNGQQACLGFVRSSMRAGAIRAAFGGIHIALVRNPFTQFTSCLRLNDFIRDVAEVVEVIEARAHNVKIWHQEFCKNLSPGYHDTVRFTIYYLFSNLSAIIHSQIIIDTDMLATDMDYRSNLIKEIESLCDLKPDFSDCMAAGSADIELNDHYQILNDSLISLNNAIGKNQFPGLVRLWNAYPQSNSIQEGLDWLHAKQERSKSCLSSLM